ncbi:MAG: SH3 domain-containing protein [Deltaproteobacteria bacterium]|nr:SH3 domain-containing protein [Deltaproteobacteria bacterium]
MGRMSTVFLVGLGLLCAVATARAADKVWVASAGAKVMAEAAASAKLVATPALGTELAVLGVAGKWLQVSTPEGATGWIYRGRVSESPPPSGGGLFGALPSSSIQASAADTSRSIRGLSPEVEQYAENAKTPAEYRKALDGVLALKVTDAEVDGFLREGKIGEYAP